MKLFTVRCEYFFSLLLIHSPLKKVYQSDRIVTDYRAIRSAEIGKESEGKNVARIQPTIARDCVRPSTGGARRKFRLQIVSSLTSQGRTRVRIDRKSAVVNTKSIFPFLNAIQFQRESSARSSYEQT